MIHCVALHPALYEFQRELLWKDIRLNVAKPESNYRAR